MKDILKVMRFDYLTAEPLALKIYAVVCVIFFLLSSFIAPLLNCYITFASMIFVIALHTTEDKSGFNKMYGILPVKRKNITRARFLYMFLVFFLTELLETLLMLTDMKIRLYRFLPDRSTNLAQIIEQNYSDTQTPFIAVVAMTVLMCLIFSYVEMMGQIFGRENEMKIILITLGVMTVIFIGFFKLTELEIIPRFRVPEIPSDTAGMIKAAAVLNAVILAFSVIFGEITAAKLEKREL